VSGLTGEPSAAPRATGQPALDVTDLHVRGPAGPIVGGVSLDVRFGETVAIVGESGSGKSVTARSLAGLLPPGLVATGTMTIGGTELPLDGGHRAWRGVRGSRITLLPQDPFTSLSPRHRCGDQIAMPLRGLSKSERTGAVLASLEEVGLPARVARQYPFQLSGGMRQRVAIAAALVTKPDVLIADEATTALDVTTQREVLELLTGLQRDREMGLILVTHDLGVARGRADRIMVLYAGRVAETGRAADVLADPAHPYTGRLLDCDPPLDVTLERLPTIPGSVPRLAHVGDACTFAPRCELATDACRVQAPALADIGPQHRVACVHTIKFQNKSPERTVVPADGPRSAPAPAGADGTILAIRGLRRSFGAHVALDGIDLDIGPGESVAVVGESGSGKTTLARIVVGLETADEGTVTFAGPPERPGSPRPPQIVFQDPYSALNPSLAIGSSLRDALRAGGRSRSEVPELLEMVGLPAAYARRRPRALSGGERQRVAIARALATRPDLLVCDEAVSSLDVSVQAQILNLIADLRATLGLSVLFISHDLAVVRQASQRVYVLNAGRIAEHGATADVLTNPRHDYTRLLMASVPSARRLLRNRSTMQRTKGPAPFTIERVAIDGATREGLELLGLPAGVVDRWARFTAPLIRHVFVAREAAGIAGAAITVGRPLASYLKIGGTWAGDGVAPQARPALERALAQAAEEFAWESGFVVVKHECAAPGGDEDTACFGEAAGYVPVPAPEIGAPIPDPGPAVPAAEFKWRTRTTQTTVPYMRQTTDFTCGPAALSMLLAHYGILERLDRATEVELWRQATMVGGCDPYGLAVAAHGRGVRPRIVISTDGTLFLGEVKTEQERELRRFIQDGFKHRARQAGIETERRTFDIGELERVIRAGGAAMVLVDELLVHGDVCGHWILVHAMEGDVFLAHDPWTEVSQGESWVDGYDVPYPADALDRIAWSDQPPSRAMLTFTR
jgi:peptide/nickel transport system ATP-binding protein